jgi:two-component system invasion response regulator UvrY
MEKITVLITDDHTLVRESWAMILDADPRFNVVGQCGSGEEALELVESLRPNVVIMDINLPGMTGLHATTDISRSVPASKVLVVSLHTRPVYVRKLMQSGASGYVTKNSSQDELMHAIEEVHHGRKYICEEIKNILAEQAITGEKEEPGLHALSKRELTIISFLKNGLSSKEIAENISVSVKTVEVHRYNILRKLNLPNVAALVNYVNHSQMTAEL